MKFSKQVLIEIMAIVQDGLMTGSDVSQALRDLDLEVDGDHLDLSREYLAVQGRLPKDEGN